jgi:molybdopterin converting factor subunit 1
MKMTVTVKFFSAVREIVGLKGDTLELPAGATLGSVWQRYKSQYPRLEKLNLAYAVNHQYSQLDRVLQDGDEVALIPPVSGG